MTRAERDRLYAARELVLVDLLDHTLAALDIALVLEHPTLHNLAPLVPPPTLRRARALVRAARLLRAELLRYRAAVDASLAAPESDELPF
jgi:hypothetical protein